MASESTDALKLGVSVAGETLVPGGSNLIKGDLGQAGVHLVLGLAARSLFGLPGLAIVSANSLVKATTGQHLTQYLGLSAPAETAPPAPPAKA